MHSKFSDGTLWPDQLAAEAKGHGLEYVSVTDHDTMGGIPEFFEACVGQGLKAVAGCEFDCVAKEFGYRSELLGYFPEGVSKEVTRLLEGTIMTRERLLKGYVERSREVFRRNDLSFDEMACRRLVDRDGSALPKGLSWNKVDLYSYLSEKEALGATHSYRDFRKAYFETGLLQVKKEAKPTCEDVVKVVRASNGIAVVPHLGHEFDDSPERLVTEKKRLGSLLEYFWEIGARGVELYFYGDAKHGIMNEMIRERALRIGFRLTYGSDCHGPGSGKHTMGKFYGDMDEPLKYLA